MCQETVTQTGIEALPGGKQVLKLTAEVQEAVQVRGTDQSTVGELVMTAATTGTGRKIVGEPLEI